ncbi:ComEA family DNA-binding protein [Geofilum sp. OHC36d9]|uniref:ComEA family DNA-binding protein n=1 Tax=Geofilum sp. OHC36d9 TaxID=3458413 RepID=UPI004033B8C2
MRYFISVLIGCGIVVMPIWSQSEDDVQLWASEIVEQLAASADEEADYSYLLDELLRLRMSPLRINSATREDFERILFLDDDQIEALLYARHQLGRFTSLYELQMVEGFSRQTIEWLAPVIIFDEVTEDAPKRVVFKGDWLVRVQALAEIPAGYKDNEAGETAYAGNRLKFYSRLQMVPTANLEVGLVTEKDAGEPAFSEEIKTLDYINGYISWKPKGVIKQIILGQYRMRAGQGLVLQSSLAPRKSSMATAVRSRYPSCRPSLSVAESGGLKGALLSLGSDLFTATPFFSYQKRDASWDEDDSGNIVYRSLKTDGYHRTVNELSQKQQVGEMIYGLQLKYFLGRFILDAGHLEYQLRHPVEPELKPYNRFYLRGTSHRNSWLSVDGALFNIHCFGEVAYDYSGKPAYWIGTRQELPGSVSLAFFWRRIPVDFQSPLGAPLTESSVSAGETGWYLGLETGLPGRFSLATYFDYFDNKWLRSQTNAPADGFDFLLELKHAITPIWQNTFRYRHKEKVVDSDSETPDYPVEQVKTNQLRIQSRYDASEKWRFTTRMDMNFMSTTDHSPPMGFLMAQDIRFANNKWVLTARYALMDTRDYATRVYAYEPDVLYGFSVPSYYGRGSRCLLLVRYNITRKWDVWLRYALWNYSDRDQIGSGYNLVESNKSNEIKVQMRWKF